MRIYFSPSPRATTASVPDSASLTLAASLMLNAVVSQPYTKKGALSSFDFHHRIEYDQYFVVTHFDLTDKLLFI